MTFPSWNATVLARAFLGVGLLAAATWLLRRRPAALVFLLLGTGTLFLFTWLRWPGYLRHHGHFFLVVLGALWLAADSRTVPLGRTEQLALFGLALLHVAAGAWAMAMDMKYPFSDSRAAAGYIRAGRLNDLPIVGTRDCIVSPLSTYLDRPIYYPEHGGWGGAWTARYRERYFDPLFALEAARKMAAERHGAVLLVLSRPMPAGQAGPRVIPLRNFDASLLAFDSGLARLEPEHFYFYEVLPAAD